MAITPKVDYEYSEGQITGEELAKEMVEQGIVNSPIYISPAGYHCSECYQVMAGGTSMKNGKMWAEVFCSNLNCSQNFISKFIELPVIRGYVFNPSDV